ncbi:coiled-coil domain-containing protein 9 [Microcaecilia unicolor]|uniref:Coiled-coil domain-containing protein 9 n=1 Tax=Microcaecilia unicolor TaxID=1415580 RepID=A0A6P7ZE11_9AMPH|nr:coiled-coil domain-containing protein 9 [Microcaecilia unicolor]
MSSPVDLKSKEEKDAELDKKIEALRKKNQALMKRYQEIEEDRKKAEEEGIAVTMPRNVKYSESEMDKKWKDRANLSITVDTTSSSVEKRVINDRKAPPTPRNVIGPPNRTSPPRDPGRITVRRGPSPSNRSPITERPNWEGSRDGMGRGGKGRRSRGGGRVLPGYGGRDLVDYEGGAAPYSERGRGSATSGRGGRAERGARTDGGGGDADGTLGGPDRKNKEWEEKRRQNIEKMNEDMEKIAEYERNQRDGVREKNPFRNFLDDPRRSGQFMELDRKEGSRRHNRNWGGADFEKVKTGMEQERASRGRRLGPKNAVDMTLSMTGRERAEYMRWKKEREQIDQERLARHRKPTGQWRREWDAEKNEAMFKDGVEPVSVPVDQGGRREESRRPPKPATFGEFLSEGRTAEPGRKKGRGRSGVQGKVYSMHDDRWEKGEEEEMVESKDDQKMEKEERTPELERSPK